MTGISTHVLDLANGEPAAGVAVRLLRKDAGGALLDCVATVTDQDGRAKLLDLGAVRVGAFRLEFEIGAYFREKKHTPPSPAFLDVVVVDFVVSDPPARLHVPLLVSPFGYSTYRGS